MIRYTPPRRKGRRGLLMDRIRANVWPLVLHRDPPRTCEGCGARNVVLEWAHVFGRPGSGFCLGEIANSAELTTKLCRPCHNALDRHTDAVLTNKLWVTAIVRLMEATIGLDYAQGTPDAQGGGVRAWVRLVEEAGWRFDADTCRLVQAA